MVDQNSQFYAILTNVGAAKQANADALGIAWKITQMGVGDANGNDPTPNATQVSLINEWRRAPLNQLKVDDKNSAVIVAEQVIPAEVGGRWIREIALYDADGDMVAVANCAPTYKPLLSQGSGRTQVVRMNLVVSSASNVQLKIDPSVVLATREWVTEELARQDFKHSVAVATTANISLSGLQTVDGVALLPGNRVLVKNQTAANDNGLYSVAAGVWVRTADADTSAKVTPGLLVHVEKGTLNSDSIWQLVTHALISLGVSGLNFEMVFGRTGVAAGTYRSVTVDKNGHVTAATSPTTVAGYGLTDVYTKAEVTAALALKAALDSPFLTGNPRVPTVVPESNDYSAVNTYWARRLMAQFSSQYGLGHSYGGVIPATTDELATLYSGNYYYPSNISPYPIMAFVQRMTYANNRGFEIANYPYQKRILGRVSNNDGTWQEPFELANLESPAFTGIPTCQTAVKGSNTLQLANTAFVQAAIAALVDSAPGTLDTLKELATALGNDPSFSTTVLNALAQKLEVADIGYGGYALDYPGNDLNTKVNKSAIYRLRMGALNTPPGLNPQGSIVQNEAWGQGVYQQTVREHATGREWHRSIDQAAVTEWLENTSNMAGAVVAFAMNAAPTGFLIANGAAVSRAAYPLLFSRIGTQYGAGNGSTTFNLPDLRAEVIRGLDAGRGIDVGRVFATVQLDALQGHGHQNTAMRIGMSGGSGELLAHNNGASNEVLKGRITAPVDLTGYGTVRIASETRMRNIALLYCIKY